MIGKTINKVIQCEPSKTLMLNILIKSQIMIGTLTFHTLDFNPQHLPGDPEDVVKTSPYKNVVNFILIKFVK
jgi:hypothetical protein